MRRIYIVIFVSLLILSGCSAGISQEDYDEVLKQKNEIEKAYVTYRLDLEESSIKKVETELSSIIPISVSESQLQTGKKILHIWYEWNNKTDIEKKYEEIPKKLTELSKLSWFDYDYIIINIWGDNIGLISTAYFYGDSLDEIDSYYWLDIGEDRISQSSEPSKEHDIPEDNPNIPLNTGKYIVGEDIPEGKYNVFGVQSGLFKVSSKGTEYGDICSEIIDPKEGVYHNLTLKDGDTVELTSGGCVILIVQ